MGMLWAFPQEHRYRLDRGTFPELFRLMARRRIPLLAKETLFQLKELLEACPELIVVAMNQGPHGLDRHLRPLMDAFPHSHVDTSYLLVEGLIEELCSRYGPERLLFGTAYPDNCGGGALLRLAQADIGDDARSLIAAGNIERLLGWSEASAASSAQVEGSADASPETRPAGRVPTISSQIVAEYLANGRSDRCPIIDLHGHWGPFAGSYLPCAREKQMLRALECAGVKRIVCSSHDALLADPAQGNRDMEQAVARNPDVLAAYWLVNPNYPELAAWAAENFQQSRGFVGLNSSPITTSIP